MVVPDPSGKTGNLRGTSGLIVRLAHLTLFVIIERALQIQLLGRGMDKALFPAKLPNTVSALSKMVLLKGAVYRIRVMFRFF